MKNTKWAYWIFTGLLAVAMIFSSIGMVQPNADAIKLFNQIGFPKYMIPFIGWAKIIGVLALLIPGNWRIKEWAYAGLTFDVVGAIYCFASIGLPVLGWSPMFVYILLIASSYYFHLRMQKLKETETLHVNASMV